MRKLLVILFLIPLISKSQLLNSVTQISSYNNPFAQLIIVNDTVRGGQFMPYAGTDAADSGMIFTDANGRKWKRALRQDEGINIAWYGAATSQTATNNRNYVIKARDYIYSHGLYKMVVPKGNYQLSDSILFDKSIVIEGEGAIGYPVSQFSFPANTTGFVFQPILNGFGVEMRNIMITGQLSPGYNKTTKHAIVQRTRVKFENVVISQFDGNGFHVSACGTQPNGDNNNYGSADNSVYKYVAAYYCTNGFFTEGCDGHILDIGEGCDFTQNRRWGYFGNGLLGGDVLYKTHFAFNGVAVPGANSVVTYNAKYYVAKAGYDGYFGDATDSNYNKQPDTNPNYWQEVTPTMVATAWANNVRYYSGGAAIVKGANAWTKFFVCYTEGSQPPVFLNSRSEWTGGVAGAGVEGGVQENILYGEKQLYNGGFLVDKYVHVGTTTFDAAARLKVYNDYSKTQSRVSIKNEGSTSEINQQFKNSTGATGTIQYIDSSFKFYNKLNNLAVTIDSAGITANKFLGDGSALTGIQQPLVSGTNIKTINGATLLGSGDMVISGAGPSRVWLPGDVANSNAVANTIADVTGLSFPVVAGSIYYFKFRIVYSAAATTTGSRWSINGPAATFMNYSSQYTLTATSITNNQGLSGYNTPAGVSASSLSTNNIAIIEGIIQPSANGTVIARFASEISASAITAIGGRSYVEYQVIQ